MSPNCAVIQRISEHPPTGMSISSLGRNRCSSKQKHWYFVKYTPHFCGVTLYVATPVIGRLVGLYAV